MQDEQLRKALGMHEHGGGLCGCSSQVSLDKNGQIISCPGEIPNIYVRLRKLEEGAVQPKTDADHESKSRIEQLEKKLKDKFRRCLHDKGKEYTADNVLCALAKAKSGALGGWLLEDEAIRLCSNCGHAVGNGQLRCTRHRDASSGGKYIECIVARGNEPSPESAEFDDCGPVGLHWKLAIRPKIVDHQDKVVRILNDYAFHPGAVLIKRFSRLKQGDQFQYKEGDKIYKAKTDAYLTGRGVWCVDIDQDKSWPYDTAEDRPVRILNLNRSSSNTYLPVDYFKVLHALRKGDIFQHDDKIYKAKTDAYIGETGWCIDV